MRRIVHGLALLALCCLPVLCQAQEAPVKTIKVMRVGSSSFPYELIEMTRSIVEASGKFKLVCEAGTDQTGYTRLDQFVTQPGLFEEWCEQQMPRIRKGEYDFVICQTIGWPGMTPPQQDKLCTEIIPSLAQKIRDAGAEMVLYDKYIPLQYEQKNPKARTWCGHYPEGYRLNYLLHISAARAAGIDKVTFGGQVVTALWQDEHFRDLGLLYGDTGHPGPLANYISAVNLAALLTGQDPVGNPARDLPMGDYRTTAFAKLATAERDSGKALYEANKHRVRGRIVTLTDEEAATLQKAALENLNRWRPALQAALRDDAEFARTMQEIERIRGEMDKFEEYGLDAGTIARYRKAFEPAAAPGELKPATIESIRRKTRSIAYSNVAVRNYCQRFLTREQTQEAQKEYARYWQETNSKLRDDIFFPCRILEEKAIQSGRRDEAKRLQMSARMLNYVISLPAYRIVLERVSAQQQKTILTAYDVHGWERNYSPQFAAYQNENHLDKEKLYRGWDIYLTIWQNPELMDRMRDNNYDVGVFKEADAEFARRIAE